MTESTAHSPQQERRREIWPTLIGVVSIVLGAWNVLVFIPNFVRWFALSLSWGNNPLLNPNWYTWGRTVTWCALNVLLILAGYRLLRWRKHRLLVAYAIGQVIYVVVGIAYDVHVVSTFAEAHDIGVYHVTWMVEHALHAVYPIFLLVWFYRKRTRQPASDPTDEMPHEPDSG